MRSPTLFESPSVRVVDYQCSAGPHDAPFAEQHRSPCLAFVYSGSFGYQVGRLHHQLVPGAVLVGRAGDEYVCSHEHHLGGDRCLSFHYAPAAADELDRAGALFRTRGVPPLAEVGVLGALALASADGTGLAPDEVALMFAARLSQLSGAARGGRVRPSHSDRKRAIRAALFVAAHAAEPLRLDDLAADAGLSAFHFLRVFGSVVGASPHQYLVRCRLRNAAHLLADESRAITDIAYAVGFADLSNFVRTFHRAAGVSPRGFRRASRGDRKILQERIAAKP